MDAANYIGAGKIEARTDATRPRPGAGEVLVAVHACGICGSDRHMYRNDSYRGQLVRKTPEGYEVPGHEFAGTIVELGEGVTGWSTGERVVGVTGFGGGMAEYVTVPVNPFQLVRIPAGVSFAEAATTEPMADALQMVRKANITAGENVVVFGVGIIGLGVIQAIRAREVPVGNYCDRRAGRAPGEGPGSRRHRDRESARWRRYSAVAAICGREDYYRGESANIAVVFDCAGYIKHMSGPPPLETALHLVANRNRTHRVLRRLRGPHADRHGLHHPQGASDHGLQRLCARRTGRGARTDASAPHRSRRADFPPLCTCGGSSRFHDPVPARGSESPARVREPRRVNRQPANHPDQGSRDFLGWRMVALGFLAVNLAIGSTFGSFGVLIKPVAADFGASRGLASLGIAIILLLMGLSGPLLGVALRHLRIRTVMIAGALLMAAGFLLASRAPGIDLSVCHSLVAGSGCALLGIIPSSTLVTNWFVARRGLAMGLISVPLIVALAPPAVAWLIEWRDWRFALVMQAVAVLLLLPFLLLVVDRPEDIGQRSLGALPASAGTSHPLP